jgi:uncharacterized protein (TIGR03546 family)
LFYLKDVGARTMLNGFIKFLKLLNANENPAQLAGAIVLSMIMALTPFWSLHNLLVVLMLCVLRINLFTFFASFPVWSGIAWLLDPYSASIGEGLLLNDSLQALWASMYQSDLWRLAHFNNTLTIGSLLLASALAVPVYIVSVWLIKRYRDTVVAWVNRLHIVKALKASSWFQKLSSAYSVAEVAR